MLLLPLSAVSHKRLLYILIKENVLKQPDDFLRKLVECTCVVTGS